MEQNSDERHGKHPAGTGKGGHPYVAFFADYTIAQNIYGNVYERYNTKSCFSYPTSNCPTRFPIASSVILWSTMFTPWSPKLYIACVVVFVWARLAHTITYAMAQQPQRAIAFVLGVASLICALLNALVGAFA
eukprot:6193908-Pyramimonas_sp.AAC.1